MVQETLINFITDLLGAVPPEFEGLIYVFELFVLLFVLDSFFTLITGIFGLWKR